MKLLKFLSNRSLLVVLTPLFLNNFAWAWGGRGHDAICQAAVFLVKNNSLKEYLQNKPQMMGHLCNVPDIYWKSLPDAARKYGDATHFIDVEILGIKISEVPTDYRKIIDVYTGSENKFQDGMKIFSVPKELGSLWWRVDQFYRLATTEGAKIKTHPLPSGSKEEQNDELPYNQAFYSMIVNMGLMGHFVGDASQPFHNTTDYDGYAANQGGIHAYYEDAAVAYFPSDLVGKIVKKSAKIKTDSYFKPKSIIEKMRAFSEIAANELKSVLKNDPIIKPSTLRIEKGVSIKTAAERKSASIGQKNFEKLILTQMARSSLLLAHLWDNIYSDSGEPSVKSYKSYRYPLTPEFVMPDYYDIKPEETKAKSEK